MENKKEHLKTPAAIVVAGFLIMIGIILSFNNNGQLNKDKTPSEQIGITKSNLTKCINETDANTLGSGIQDSAEKAMKGLPQNELGTPYSIIIGKNGVKTDIKGNSSIDNIKKLIDEVKSGTVTEPYKGEAPEINEDDHIMGNKDAEIVIIEYSDFECPYCKAIHATLEKLVKESNGEVAWVFRHWPIHQNSFLKATASECVAQIKGNDAFFKYADALFGLLKTSSEEAMEKL